MKAEISPAMERWNRFLGDLDACASAPMPLEQQGKQVRVAGLVLEAAGLSLPVGALCQIRPDHGWEYQAPVVPEVVGFAGDLA
jgi:flagellum-specific ATP synthase